MHPVRYNSRCDWSSELTGTVAIPTSHLLRLERGDAATITILTEIREKECPMVKREQVMMCRSNGVIDPAKGSGSFCPGRPCMGHWERSALRTKSLRGRSLRVCLASILLGAFLAGANLLASAPDDSYSASSTPDAGVVGITAGNGTLMVYGTPTPFIPRGFNSVGVLFPVQYAGTMCSGMSAKEQRGLAEAEKQMTAGTDLQLLAMKDHWRANTVRFQVSQGALAYEHANGLSAYTDMVLSVLLQARAMGMVTIVSMQSESRSCTAHPANHEEQKLPNRQTEQAWAQLAPHLGQDRGIVLEVFNEPSSRKECGKRDWTYWATGCGTGTDAGMVMVGQYLRTLAPNNVLLFDGDGLPPMFTGFPASVQAKIPENSGYVAHPYDYADGAHGWDTRFGDLQTTGSPVVATEWNEVYLCKKDLNQRSADELVKNYLPAHNIGLIMHSWDAPGGVLVNRSYDPVDSVATCPATGATLAYGEFWSQAGDRTAMDVHVSLVKMVDKRVDAVSVAVASGGSNHSTSKSPVVRSVDLYAIVAGRGDKPKMLTAMRLSTESPWTGGSFTLATASGLTQNPLTAKTGDSLLISVHYDGGEMRNFRYKVP